MRIDKNENKIMTELTLSGMLADKIRNLAQKEQRSWEALVEAMLEAYVASAPETEDDHETLLEDFRQGWHEAMTGQTRPASELWQALQETDDDSTSHTG